MRSITSFNPHLFRYYNNAHINNTIQFNFKRTKMSNEQLESSINHIKEELQFIKHELEFLNRKISSGMKSGISEEAVTPSIAFYAWQGSGTIEELKKDLSQIPFYTSPITIGGGVPPSPVLPVIDRGSPVTAEEKITFFSVSNNKEQDIMLYLLLDGEKEPNRQQILFFKESIELPNEPSAKFRTIVTVRLYNNLDVGIQAQVEKSISQGFEHYKTITYPVVFLRKFIKDL